MLQHTSFSYVSVVYQPKLMGRNNCKYDLALHVGWYFIVIYLSGKYVIHGEIVVSVLCYSYYIHKFVRFIVFSNQKHERLVSFLLDS
jgi:hypothetical protein